MTNLLDTQGKQLGDQYKNAFLSAGTAVPSDGTSGYNTGALFQETDGASPAAVFVNLGTTASAAFRALGVGASTNDGFNAVQTVKATFDPSGTTSQRAAGTYTLGATVPSGALVVGGYARVLTAFSSSGSTAAVSVLLQGANDVISSATVGGAPWSTTGTKAVVPNGTTAGGGIATTAAQAVKVIVANEALTGGKASVWLNYIV
jgi:hypothetical protein